MEKNWLGVIYAKKQGQNRTDLNLERSHKMNYLQRTKVARSSSNLGQFSSLDDWGKFDSCMKSDWKRFEWNENGSLNE